MATNSNLAGDHRPAKTDGPAGDVRAAREAGPAGDPRPAKTQDVSSGGKAEPKGEGTPKLG